MTDNHVVSVTDETFEYEVLKSGLPTVVDFWTEWCKYCVEFRPVFEREAEKYHSKIKFVKLNADENPVIADKQEIVGIPTTKLFYKGEIKGTLNGAVDEIVFDSFLKKTYEELMNEKLT